MNRAATFVSLIFLSSCQLFCHSKDAELSCLSKENDLITAIHENNIPEIQRLIEVGANIHAEQEKALRFACRQGSTAMVELLIEAGADSSVDNYGELILAHLSFRPLLLQALTGLTHEGKASSLDKERKAAAKLAVFTKTFNPQETYCERALLCACIDNNVASAQELIEKKGAVVSVRENLALKIAFQNNYTELVKLLLLHGASIDGLTVEEFAATYAPRKNHGLFSYPLKREVADINQEKKEALAHILREGPHQN